MKKILSLLMVFLLVLGFSSCDQGDENTEKHYITVTEYTLKTDITLEDMAKQIRKQYSFDMPMEISDKTLESIFHISPTTVETYAGVFSISMSSADNVLIVKPVNGKSAVVKHGIEQRRQDVIDTFTGYLEDSLSQAENSFVMEKDGYYIYLSVDAEKEAVEEYILTTFFDMNEKQIEVSAEEAEKHNSDNADSDISNDLDVTDEKNTDANNESDIAE